MAAPSLHLFIMKTTVGTLRDLSELSGPGRTEPQVPASPVVIPPGLQERWRSINLTALVTRLPDDATPGQIEARLRLADLALAAAMTDPELDRWLSQQDWWEGLLD